MSLACESFCFSVKISTWFLLSQQNQFFFQSLKLNKNLKYIIRNEGDLECRS